MGLLPFLCGVAAFASKHPGPHVSCSGLPKTIMVIRHGERPCREPGSNIAYNGVSLFGEQTVWYKGFDIGSNSLIVPGWLRAGALVHRFGVPSAWGPLAMPVPSHVFACVGEHGWVGSDRPAQTVLQLACKLNGVTDHRCMRGFFGNPAELITRAVPYPNTDNVTMESITIPVGPGLNVGPLSYASRDLRVPLNIEHDSDDYADAAPQILQSGADATVLVSWSHHAIPLLVAALHKQLQTCGSAILDFEKAVPTYWPANIYDMILALDKTEDGYYTFRQVPEQLLASDLGVPICSPAQLANGEPADCETTGTYWEGEADASPEWCWKPPPWGNVSNTKSE